jgi:hypothetical protein
MAFKAHYATLALLSISVAAGHATTINFSALDDPETDRVDLAPTGYSVDGYTFTGTQRPGIWTTGDPGFPIEGIPDNPAGGAANVSLSTFFAGGVITMTKDDNQAFNVLSIDVAQWGAFPENFSGTYAAFFSGYDAGNNLIASQVCTGPDVANGQPVLSTCNLSGFLNISSLVFTEGTYESGEAAQFTNIVVTSATPEPGTPFLIGSGLLGVMALIRKRFQA